jgi:hypothetical protein
MRCVVLHVGQRIKLILRQPFVAHRPVEALDIGILLGLAGLDEVDPDILRLSPSQRCDTDVFWAVVASDRCRLAAPLNDLVEAAHHPQRR